MNIETAQQIIKRKFRNRDFKFIGAGSDSIAFRIYDADGDMVIRFSDRTRSQFKKEAAVCKFIRPFISVNIPDIRIVDGERAFYVTHRMLTGNKWSWHKFMYNPTRQNNLADSLGKFMAQLHGIKTTTLKRAVPDLKQDNIPYTSFEDSREWLGIFMGRRRLEFFKKNYQRIIGATVPKSDMVLVHMGIKGPNSVVDDTGSLCGVFDFCNCGIYERWREFAIMYLARNKRLYNGILRAYETYSGVKANRNRIADLAAIEFMWEKRRKRDGKVIIDTGRFVKKNIAFALTRFYGLPRWCAPFIHMQLKVHQWWTLRHRK